MIAVAAQDPQLAERAVAARAAADQARALLDDLKARLLSAVGTEDYGQAEQLKAQVTEAHRSAGHAEAEARAIEAVLEQYAAEEHAQAEQVEAEARRARARRDLEQVQEAEREGLDELQRIRGEVEAGIDAVHASINTGIALEQAVHKARQDADAALVVLGEREPGMFLLAPNTVTAWIRRSPTLQAIADGKALPR